MAGKAFQDLYPDSYAHCYGCGRLNDAGLKIKSYWEGDEGVCRFTPQSHQTGGFPHYLYGGLIASLMDCHGAGTAAAAKGREMGIELDVGPLPRFVTASLKVDYLCPTPVDKTLEIRARVREISGRKVFVEMTLSVENKITARGEVLMVQIPEK